MSISSFTRYTLFRCGGKHLYHFAANLFRILLKSPQFCTRYYIKHFRLFFLDTLYIGLTKAFDTVNHDKLLYKLQNYGIRGIAYHWFKSYLCNRQQYTVSLLLTMCLLVLLISYVECLKDLHWDHFRSCCM